MGLILLVLELFLVFNSSRFVICINDETVITTTSGRIKGQVICDQGVSFLAYRGIPYAEAPIGPLRFKPPVPKNPWTGILDATESGPICPQPKHDYFKYARHEMSEDCLNLNIFIPIGQKEALLPVLVFVHSGSFLYQSGRDDELGPQFYMKYGVIVVTFNYRLGALGFLSIQTEEASGNAGIKDTLLVLRWVSANMNRFGGDPDRVTLFGSSNSAAIVHLLTLSKQSTGLFQRAILMSGSALSSRFLNRYPIDGAVELGAKLGYKSKDINELVENLRRTNVFDIIQAQGNDTYALNGMKPYAPFVPVVEAESPHAVITKHPLEIIKSGLPDIPILAGNTDQEGIFRIPHMRVKNFTNVEILNSNFELFIPSNIEYPFESPESKELARSMKILYFRNENISESTIQGYVDLITDVTYVIGVDYWIKVHKSVNNRSALYYYVFNFDGDVNWAKRSLNISYKGAAHSDDKGYTFVTSATKPYLKNASKETKETINVMMRLWTNFIKYGNPTPTAQVINNVTVNWTDCGQGRNYLLLNNRPRMVEGPPMRDRLGFWNKVYDEYERYVKNGGRLEAKLIP